MVNAITIRVDDPTYRGLLTLKHRLERKEHRRVPIGDAVKELLKNQKED